MNDLSLAATVTMTSLELVDFINAHRDEEANAAGATFPCKGFARLDHADLMKKVPEVLGANAGKFSGIYRDSRNRAQGCYNFPKREASLMAMSYSYELQAKVFDRMTALESQGALEQFAIPQTRSGALRLAADLADQNQELSAQVRVMTPKVEALTRLALADGSLCITSAAKHLQVQPKFLFAWLSEHQWIYRRAGSSSWLGYQSRIQSGLLEHKVNTVERGDGSEKITEQCRITPRGLAKLAELLNAKGAT